MQALVGLDNGAQSVNNPLWSLARMSACVQVVHGEREGGRDGRHSATEVDRY